MHEEHNTEQTGTIAIITNAFNFSMVAQRQPQVTLGLAPQLENQPEALIPFQFFPNHELKVDKKNKRCNRVYLNMLFDLQKMGFALLPTIEPSPTSERLNYIGEFGGKYLLAAYYIVAQINYCPSYC